MSIKPSGYPEWASQTTTGITEPTSAKKKSGWGVGEKPAAQYLNWLQEKSSAWIRYLSYDWLINDDFTTPPGQVAGADGPTSSVFMGNGAWGGTPVGSGAFDWRQDSISQSAVAMGVLQMTSSDITSQPVRLEKSVGIPGFRDVIYEVITSNNGNNTVFGIRRHRYGIINGTNTGDAFFSSTAMTASGLTGPGHWWFHWNPSSMGETYVDLGVTESVGVYQRLCFERVGQTMLVDIDGQSRLAFYAGNVFFSPTGCRVGIEIDSGMGASFTSAIFGVDKIKFGVRR